MRIPSILLLSATLFASCNSCNQKTDEQVQEHAGPGTQGNSTAEAQRQTAAPADPRDEWMQPATLFEVAGGVKGKIVADLFAGDGYMAFKLVDAGARVIAIDTDPQALAAIEQRKKELGIGDDRLITRTTTTGEPGLGQQEADMAFCVHHYTSIQDRAGYFYKVRAGLRHPAPVLIVDFLMTQTPVGPPLSDRVSENQILDELDPAGFTDIGAYSQKIPYQYIVVAQDFVPGPDTGGPMVSPQ